MTAAGVTAEYNVFHNGHLYQLQQIKEQCGAVVAVMSGSFVQRGDIAITDKWQRAAAAVRNGADLVVELPVVYALNTAQKFARGAVHILNMCGVDRVYFGSECGDIDGLKNTAALLENEPREVSDKIKTLMSNGLSFPMAREKAFEGIIPAELINKPNNILAIEYIRAMTRQKSGMTAHTIKRTGAEHNGKKVCRNIASASKIREMLLNGEDYRAFTPVEYTNIPYNIKNLEMALIYRLRSMTASELSQINEAGEGIENRIIAAAREYDTAAEILEAVKTKRYTESRIRRIMLSALLGIQKGADDILPSYIRVLALNATGAKLLKKAKSGADIITKTADYKKDDMLFKKDILSTDIAALCAKDKRMRGGGADYIMPPVFIKNNG